MSPRGDEQKFHDLIPNSLLLHLEAGRNLETFIASTSGLKPFSSTTPTHALGHKTTITTTKQNKIKSIKKEEGTET